MKISTKGRYALRMMLDLGMHNTGEYISLRDISQRQDITVKYLEQIVMTLTKAGYLRSQRGNNGGYRLARDPSEYRVGDILRVMEGSLAPITCLEEGAGSCPRSGICPVLPFWTGLDKVIAGYVDRFTLQDLIEQSSAMAGYDYST
ncbi:MAG: Rrf2 family transcriptional regulator [Lachnospiraceae bacterium]|jgi:Rrf2 family protein|nr:Rrf2 family transcriptional regulator [Lachnospiraceae bacterium]